jgi:superfamily II DNA or RNA helicase
VARRATFVVRGSRIAAITARLVLESVLSEVAIRALGGASFQKGHTYFRRGSVESFRIEVGALVGSVLGTERYQVRIEVRGGALVGSCSCPVGVDCKHAVALALAYLDRTPAKRAGAPAGLFETREEVDAWAKEHGVTHALAIAATMLPLQNGAPYQLQGLSLRDVAAWGIARRYLPYAAESVARSARAFLEAEAERVEVAIAEEREPRAFTGGGDEARLWEWLVAERARIRPHASPRPRAWRAQQRWMFDLREREIAWRETMRLVDAKREDTRLGGALVLACGCTALGQPTCAHALALVDVTLDRLEDGTAGEAPRELLRPSWSRALVDLARARAQAAPPVVEVWWQIEDELRVPTLTPIIRKQGKRGLSSGNRMRVARLLDERGAALGAQDRAIADRMQAWDARNVGSFPATAFKAAIGHPRLLDEDGEPVTLAGGALGLTAVEAGDALRVELAIESEPLDPALTGLAMASLRDGEPLLLDERARGRYLLVEANDATREVWSVLARHRAEFPPEAHGELLGQLAALDAAVPITIPEHIKGEPTVAVPRVVIRMRLAGTALELEPHVRPAPGAPLFAPGCGPRDVIFAAAGKRAYVRRDLDAERTLSAGVLVRWFGSAGAVATEGPPGCFHVDDLDQALALVQQLTPPPADFDAEWIDERPQIGKPLTAKQLRVDVKRERDWFGITGEVKVEAGRIELAVLLDAARRQRRFVQVGEQRWVELTAALRQRLRAVADQTFTSKQHLELSPGAVRAIADLADAGVRVAQDTTWRDLTERLLASSRLRPKPPATLVATLRDYQVEGHAWLSRLAAWGTGACLADDMGLGKTIQTIALLLDRAKLGPALVLAPTSVCFNWIDELARFAPTLRPVIYRDAPDRAACLAGLGKRDVLIASYGLLVRDAAQLARRPFATLVLDEAQAVKNATTRRAKAARALDAGFRVALSGTPLENHLGELWSLFAIVFPGLLGSWEQFRERFAMPIERAKDAEAHAALARVIRPFLLRRTKAEVARELPPRTEIALPIVLSEQEHALYEDARLAAIAQVTKQSGLRDEQRRFQILAALTRLRLLASHPRLHDPTSQVPSSKLARLVELLEELRDGGHRALVFSQFTSHLALVREQLTRVGFTSQYLDGSTPAAARKTIVEAFQRGEGDVFLISLKAGGTGLNLTAADYVIHLDPWWNPAVEDQASDRAHRIGQTKPVTVYRLIARGTIEEAIIAMHADKRALVASILEGTGTAARLSTKDLMALLAQSTGVTSDDGD